MAGGEGRRLRPLTTTVPKPMVRISGKPVIEYIFDLLLRHGIEDAYLSLGYMAHIIENEYENGYKNLNFKFSVEDKPLGTAGGVKNAVINCNDDLLVISGDALCDFNLTGILAFHKASEAKITIVAKEVDEPSEYGVIITGENNKVVAFAEKPSCSQAVSNLANTGVYIISPEVLSSIPDNTMFDFSGDLFPLFLEKQDGIYCYKTDGYWCDVGSIESYLSCQKDALDGKFSTEKINIYDMREINVIPPVYIGENVDISASAVIGPYTCIDDNAVVSDGAKISNSTVLSNSFIGENALVDSAVLCGGCAVGSNAEIQANCVVGAGAIVGKNSLVKPYVKIWPGKVIPYDITVDYEVKHGVIRKHFVVNDNGIKSGSDFVDVLFCTKLGCAVGSIKTGISVAVAHDGSKTAQMLAKAFSSGAESCGAYVSELGGSFKSQLDFFVSDCEFDCGLLFSSSGGNNFYICGEGGLPVTRQFERKIEAAVFNSEYCFADEEMMKRTQNLTGIKQLYDRALIRFVDNDLSGLNVDFVCENQTVKETAIRIFESLGGKIGKDIVFDIDRNSCFVTAITSNRVFDFHTLLAIVCKDLLMRGKDISVPFDSPEYIDGIGECYSRKVYRFLSAPCNNCDLEARVLAAKQFYLRDALFIAMRILSIMKSSGKTLDSLYSSLPKKFVSDERVAINYSPSSLLGLLGKDRAELKSNSEGLRLNSEKGKVRIIPERSGEWLRVLAEADTMESANELCVNTGELLSSYNLK